jgi:hypothetical protein
MIGNSVEDPDPHYAFVVVGKIRKRIQAGEKDPQK